LLIHNFFFSLSFQIVFFLKAENNIHPRPSDNPIDENYYYLLLLYYYIIQYCIAYSIMYTNLVLM
jgi:hypothetical protein